MVWGAPPIEDFFGAYHAKGMTMGMATWFGIVMAVFVGIWLLAVFLVVMKTTLQRRISPGGFWGGSTSEAGATSFLTRPQMIVFSLAAAASYGALGLNGLGQESFSLPESPDWLLNLVGISSGVYVGGRGYMAATVFQAMKKMEEIKIISKKQA
jgi:hypothetical protein